MGCTTSTAANKATAPPSESSSMAGGKTLALEGAVLPPVTVVENRERKMEMVVADDMQTPGVADEEVIVSLKEGIVENNENRENTAPNNNNNNATTSDSTKPDETTMMMSVPSSISAHEDGEKAKANAEEGNKDDDDESVEAARLTRENSTTDRIQPSSLPPSRTPSGSFAAVDGGNSNMEGVSSKSQASPLPDSAAAAVASLAQPDPEPEPGVPSEALQGNDKQQQDVPPASTVTGPIPEPPVKKGMMVKQGHLVKNMKNRFFILEKGLLTYYENQSTTPPYGVNKKGEVSLKGTSLSIDKNNLSIMATDKATGKETLVLLLEVKYANERDEWIDAIRQHTLYVNSL